MDKELALIYEEIVAIAKGEAKKLKSAPRWGTASAASSDGKVEILFDDGTSSTPCSTVAKVHQGDRVMVQVDAESRTATVTGNYSDPAATDSEVRVVNEAAERAAGKADDAAAAAASAIESASEAYTAARAAQASADAAAEDAISANRAADTATAMAESATRDASEAMSSASQATRYAGSALSGLAEVEDVVDVLNWLASHGRATEDTVPVDGKAYYVRGTDGSMSRVEVYEYVQTQDSSPTEGKTYYVLVTTDNYIQADVEAFASGVTYYEYVGTSTSEYVQTADSEPADGKTYYTAEYAYSEFDGGSFEEDVTYYELEEYGTTEYVATEDGSPQSGKSYYVAVDIGYELFEGESFESGVTYYEASETTATRYVETGDESPQQGTDYYTYDFDSYEEFDGEAFDAGTAYYEIKTTTTYSYEATSDSSPQSGTDYYTLVTSSSYEIWTGDSFENGTTYYEYVAKNPASEGYWELGEAVSEFVAAHAAMDSHGLNVFDGEGSYRLHIGTLTDGGEEGFYILNEYGEVVGKYGESTQTGSLAGTHVEMRPDRFSFWQAGYDYNRAISEALANGTIAYVLTDDAAPMAGRTYYTRSGSGTAQDPYVYEAVTLPTVSGMAGYYELPIGLDTALPGEVAFIAADSHGDSVFYMNRAVIVRELRFAKWKWVPRANGNLSLKWIGGE